MQIIIDVFCICSALVIGFIGGYFFRENEETNKDTTP